MASAAAQGSTAREAGYAVGARQRAATLAVVFVLFMLNYMDRNVLPAVAEYMKRDLSLSDAQIGAIQTVCLVCVAGLAVPAAFTIDRWSRRKSVALMALVWSLATALTGVAGGFGMLLLARALVGVGEAGFSSGGTAMLSAAFPQSSRAKVLGVFNAAVPLGMALGTVLGAILAERTGSWSTPFFVFAVPGMIMAAVTLLLRDYRTVAADAAPAIVPAVRALFRIPTLRSVYFAYGMNSFIAWAVLAWLPVYLARSHSLDLAAAGQKAGLVLALALVGAPFGGWLGDRWAAVNPRGHALSCATTSLLAAVALAGALLLGRTGEGFALLIVYGVLATAYLAPSAAITQDVVHPGLRATSYGTCVLCMYLLGGAYAPVLVGALSDHVGIEKALLVAPAAGVLASILFLVAARTYVADRGQVQEVALQRE